MSIRNGGLLAALLAIIAAGIVSYGAWFTLTHGNICNALLGACDATSNGVIILFIMVAAGGLLSFAFGQVEKIIALFKQQSSDGLRGKDDRA